MAHQMESLESLIQFVNDPLNAIAPVRKDPVLTSAIALVSQTEWSESEWLPN